MKLPGFLDPIKEYLVAIKWALIVAAFAATFIGGCQHGKDVQGEKDAKALNTAAAKLRDANTALTAAGQILTDVSAETKRRVERDRLAAIEAKKAATQAEDARVAAQRRANKFEQELEAARKKKPDCALLLSTDVKKVCGL